MGEIRFLTAGESHGKALVGILEGLPSGLALSSEKIGIDLRRRKLGFGRGGRQAIEKDAVDILCGVRDGRTLGSPIGLIIANQDWENWKDIMRVEAHEGPATRVVEVPRPGHADWVGALKYKHVDMRNVLERSSARETTMRVALGACARALLEECGVQIASHVVQVGAVACEQAVSVPVSQINEIADASPLRVLDPYAEQRMILAVEAAKSEGNTLGGTFEVWADGLPQGLGSYVQWDRRLEADIGKAFLSLNAIKGVEIGLGFGAARLKGSDAHDALINDQGSVRPATNRSGGLDGGMSNGQPLIVRAAMKPLSTLMRPLPSVHLQTGESAKAHVERSDVCAVPSAAVIGESLLALVVANALLEKFGGDSMIELKERVNAWRHSGIAG